MPRNFLTMLLAASLAFFLFEWVSELVYLTSLLNSQGLMSDGPVAEQWDEGWNGPRHEYTGFRTRDPVVWSRVFYRSTSLKLMVENRLPLKYFLAFCIPCKINYCSVALIVTYILVSIQSIRPIRIPSTTNTFWFVFYEEYVNLWCNYFFLPNCFVSLPIMTSFSLLSYLPYIK